ncbi:hypothetical protein [Blastococcus sp. VKM Ac-2987]|uniref:hypothetical protein n=1 Tax=Blastococcus sp. VKM Ac-2987 TaxID=3004141 RepID=UPI0022AB90B6|nr:hypothetical protein [Blastococcus sp. VKM Ac-2987]MCZ2859154.1 hypothetical protein [Blastococcus sp. VKM Ac-2987]
MASNGPDPRDFLDMAQKMLRQLFDEPRRDDQPWADVTREAARRRPEPSPEEQRENLTFALATRAVEALEDLALNVAAIRQRLERTGAEPQDRPGQQEDPPGR